MCRYVKNRVTVGTNTSIDLGRVEIYNVYVSISKSPLKHFIKAWTRWQIPDRVGGWIAGRQPVGAAPMEWSSVRVTSGRCAQPIHNSKWPVIRGRKALEMILRDQREEAEPRWSARPPPGDKPPLLCLQQLTSGGCYICMRDFGKSHLMLRIYAGWYREISGSERGRLRL